jgi:hypothetical protein
MNKKTFISVAPLVAIAAFVVMPAASQGACTPPACPHVYLNGAKSPEGTKKARQIAWGTLKLKNKAFGEVECHNVFGGFLTNPAGGGPAKGQIQAFAPYECESSTCIALGGKGIKVTPGKLPWAAEVIEPKPGVFREKIGHKGSTAFVKPAETEPEFVDFTVNCEGVVIPEFFGELDALILNNGISIGSGPGEWQLEPEAVNPESKDLETEILTANKGEYEGHVKVEGYGAEELISVANP